LAIKVTYMTLVVLLSLWTLHGGLAARMGVAGMEVNKVISKIESLLQSRGEAHADILNELAITPGLDLKNVIEQMADSVKAKVKAGQAETQGVINKAMDELDRITQNLLVLKADADSADGSWFACVEQEKENKADLEDAQNALANATNVRKQLCQVHEDSKTFRWGQTTLKGFTCDLSQETSCSDQVAQYSSQVNALLSALQSSESSASDEYKKAKHNCELAKQTEEEKAAAHVDALHDWQDQQKDCVQKRDVRKKSICLFGEGLQTKCSKVSDFKSFLSKVDAVNGSEHSHPDRIQEWSTADLIRCMLFEGGSDIDANLLKSCEVKVNYDRDIGEFTKRTDELAQLTSADNFTCSESTITFQGKIWDVPEGADSTEYTVHDYHPKINFEDDSAPFALCAEPVKTCGGTAFGKKCNFPFKYRDTTYFECTMAGGHNEPWCSIDYNYRGRWGNCECN